MTVTFLSVIYEFDDSLLVLTNCWFQNYFWNFIAERTKKYRFLLQCESFLIESQMTRNLFSDFWGVGGARSPSAHAKEIRKLIPLRGLSMNPELHCKQEYDLVHELL